MEILMTIFTNPLVAFLLMVGIVVFIHELGHFLMGKLLNIGIEEFALGLGPKAFSFSYKGTVYSINWLPLGGYVRFAGEDEGSNEKFDSSRGEALNTAKIYKRSLVSVAGPLANFILSLGIMTAVCYNGIPQPPTYISVFPGSAAEKAGIKDGDKIVAIDGKELHSWSKITQLISRSSGKELEFSIERNSQNISLKVIPESQEVSNAFGEKEKVGRIGVSPFIPSLQIIVPKMSFLSEVLSLKSGDKINALQGIKVVSLKQFDERLLSLFSTTSETELAQKFADDPGQFNFTLLLEFESPKAFPAKETTFEKKIVTIDFTSSVWQKKGKAWADNILSSAYPQFDASSLPFVLAFQSSDFYVQNLEISSDKDTFSKSRNALKKCGIDEGTTLFAIEGIQKLQSRILFSQWFEVTLEKLNKSLPHKSLLVFNGTLLNKNNELSTFQCSLPTYSGKDSWNRPREQIDLPLVFASHGQQFPSIVSKSDTVIDAIYDGLFYVKDQALMIIHAVEKLFMGDIPLSNLGGPLSIAVVAGDAAKAGILVFILTLSMLSINVGIMNLLPLPSLDGGHLMLHAMEAIYGKPLPLQVQAFVQRLGVVFVISLFVLVFYNDIMRIFF